MRRILGLLGTLLTAASVAGLALLAAGPAEDAQTTRAPLPAAPAAITSAPDIAPPSISATTSPTAVPTGATPPFAVSLDERFTDNRMDWPDNRESTAWLDAGGYRLAARFPQRFVAVGAPVSIPLRDVMLTASFRKVGGPPGGGYGLIVRDQRSAPGDGISQDGRYYVLEVGDRGEVGIWRRDDDHWVDLLPWTASATVHPGTEANQVEVWATGDRLTLLVNGVQVASHVDTAFASGRVGVFVGGDQNEVVLERLLVRTPEAITPTAPPSPPAALPITRVVIPRTSLDAEAVRARLVDRGGGHTWEVPPFKIGHAEGTAGAGGPGNAVLVGHVTSQTLGNVFQDLDRVRIGDEVQVFSAERRFDYRVVDVRTVTRTDVSVVDPTESASLTLMTCTGVWLPIVADYSHRLVVRAELQSSGS